MHQYIFEHRNDHTLQKNLAIVDGFEDIMKFEGWGDTRRPNVDAYIIQLLFSALRGPKML